MNREREILELHERYLATRRFSREEDLLNRVHVIELIQESGWKPGPGFTPPPRKVTR